MAIRFSRKLLFRENSSSRKIKLIRQCWQPVVKNMIRVILPCRDSEEKEFPDSSDQENPGRISPDLR